MYGAGILVLILVTVSYFVVISMAIVVLIIECYIIYTMTASRSQPFNNHWGGVYAAGMRRGLPKVSIRTVGYEIRNETQV